MSTTTKSLPRFQGKPLIKIPEIIPVANYLTGDFGKAALAEYQGRAKADYHKNSNLNVLGFEDKVVKGSNPFAVVLMNQVLGQEDIKVATLADLAKILKTNALNLRGQYEDVALVLRNTNSPNAYLAGNLQKQVKSRVEGKAQYPIMIPLVSLELVEYQDSDYGLAFRLKEDAEIIYAPQLAHKNHNKKFSETNEQGLPLFDDNGSRTLYTRDSGLSKLSLGRDLNLDSYLDGLGGSDADGRVVAIRDEATGNNFKADLTAKLNERYEAMNKRLKADKEEIEKSIKKLGQSFVDVIKK